MLENLTWLVAIASLIGAFLNARKNVKGFYIWVVTNLCWVAYDIYISQYAQAFLFLAYMGISIYGIVTWRRNEVER